jgi:hypothetical protein
VAVIVDAIVKRSCTIALPGRYSKNTGHTTAPFKMNINEGAIYQKKQMRNT